MLKQIILPSADLESCRLYERAHCEWYDKLDAIEPYTYKIGFSKSTQFLNTQKLNKNELQQSVIVELKNIRTKDGAWVRAYRLYKEGSSPVKTQRVTARIYCQGNFDVAENHLDPGGIDVEFIKKTGVEVWLFNYRETFSSQKVNKRLQRDNRFRPKRLVSNRHTMKNDARAVFDCMLASGHKPGNIEIKGMSLGGMAANLLAEDVRQDYNANNCPYLSVEKSFDSFISLLIAYMIGSDSDYKYGYLDPRNLRIVTHESGGLFRQLCRLGYAPLELLVLKPLLLIAIVIVYPIAKLVLWASG